MRVSDTLAGRYDGLRDYYPLTTSDLHFACVEIILHSLLINFQFNPKRQYARWTPLICLF